MSENVLRAAAREYAADPTDRNAHRVAREYVRGQSAQERVRKVLISGGFGAGWSTWNTANPEAVLFWAPLIEALEAGEDVTEDHPAVRSLVAEVGNVYLGGLEGLYVAEVTGPFRVTEYDGAESIETAGGDWY